jgi:hypothetical protein
MTIDWIIRSSAVPISIRIVRRFIMSSIHSTRITGALIALFSLAFSAPVFAGPQQDKMKSCNAEAKEKALKGDERSVFMSGCLSAGKEPDSEATAALKERRKLCRAEAKEKSLTGDVRKSFISECVKA